MFPWTIINQFFEHPPKNVFQQSQEKYSFKILYEKIFAQNAPLES